MKKRAIILLLVILASNLLCAQREAVIGKYKWEFDGVNGNSFRTISLNEDGTFVFHCYEKHDNGIPPERDFYAKGTWAINKKLISFSSTKNNLLSEYVLNFDYTKARFSKKSPRDKSNRGVKTFLIFYESETWVKGTKLFKID